MITPERDSISEIFAEVAENFQRFVPTRGKNRYSDETIKKFYYEMKRIQVSPSFSYGPMCTVRA